jgi:DNA-binding NarL/FixJ family response regulator
VAGLTALVAAWHFTFRRLGIDEDRPWLVAAYLAGLFALWFLLAGIHPAFFSLLLVLYPQVFRHLRLARAIPAAVVLSVAVVWREVLASGRPLSENPGAVVGGLLSVVFGTLLALWITRIIEESYERRQLIEQLEATRSELAAAEREGGRLAERQRLARDIHDTLAQGFVSIVLQLQAAEAELPADAAEARGHLERARRTARDNLAEARRLVWDLRPEALSAAPLGEALGRLAGRVAEETGLAAHRHRHRDRHPTAAQPRRRGHPAPGHPGGSGQRDQARFRRPGRGHLVLHGRRGRPRRARRRLRVHPRRRRLRPQRRARAAGHARAGRGPRGPAGRRDRPRPGHHHRRHGPGAVIRILLADDHPVVRDGLRGMLAGEADFEVVGEAASGVEAVRLTEREQPDVVLMDLQMPEMDGATATAEIAARFPGTRVLVLTTYDTDADILRAVEAGATGYLLKDTPRERLFPAIRAAARGETVLAPTVATRLVSRMRQPATEALTAREVEVLDLVARGSSNADIAAALFISEATVKTHLLHVFAKLAVDDRTAAVVAALERGIIALPRRR